ncbi:MAG: heavy metal translocating P-type ATPase [Pseudobdellovibrionaceae bacterium]
MEVSLEDRYAFLVQPEFLELYQDPVHPQRFKLQINGMKCSRCIAKIENLENDLQLSSEVLGARVDMTTGIGTFSLAHPSTLPKLISRIEDLGFTAKPIRFQQDLSTLRSQILKRDLMRLGVAGFCAGNIMMFSFAIYFGVTGALADLFSWLSFVLYLPVVSYVALPFYRGSFASVKQRSLSIDLPIAIASLTGFVFSLVNLMRDQGSIYFDSLSGFLFLILIARFFQAQLQRKFVAETHGKAVGLQEKYLVRTEGTEKWLPLEKLEESMEVLINTEDVIAFDGELIEDQSLVSLAFLNGESSPKFFSKGSIVPAGSKLLSAPTRLKIINKLQSTNFGQILQTIELGRLSKTRLMAISDKASFYLLAIVFSVAIFFWAVYSFVSPIDAAERALALIILACPCAMAFGTPLALTLGLSKASKAGLLIKTADVFEKMRAVENVFFDKTGTLTTGELQLLRTAPVLVSEEMKNLILEMEKKSLHPVAFAFRKAWSHSPCLPVHLDRVEEIYGQGVVAQVGDTQYELKRLDEGTERCVGLFINSTLTYRFYFQEELQAGSRELIEWLKESGKTVHLITGDNRERALEFAQAVGISVQFVSAAKSPEDKARIVSKAPQSLMVGDGANDAIAFRKASVGVSVTGSIQVAFEASDVYLLKDQGVYKGLRNLFEISEEAVKQVKRNLMISATYNLVGGILALAGYINPFVAAVLMPVSSGFIVLSTFIRSQK